MTNGTGPRRVGIFNGLPELSRCDLNLCYGIFPQTCQLSDIRRPIRNLSGTKFSEVCGRRGGANLGQLWFVLFAANRSPRSSGAGYRRVRRELHQRSRALAPPLGTGAATLRARDEFGSHRTHITSARGSDDVARDLVRKAGAASPHHVLAPPGAGRAFYCTGCHSGALIWKHRARYTSRGPMPPWRRHHWAFLRQSVLSVE